MAATSERGFLERRLLPLFAKMSSQRHLVVIRQSFLLIIPLVLVGSVFQILPNVPGLNTLLAPYAGKFNLANQATFGLIAIYLTFSLSYNLASTYELDALSVSLASVIAYVLSVISITQVEGVDYLSMQWLGSWGLFGAIVIGIYSAEVFRIFTKRGWVFKMPAGVPSGVTRFMASIIPEFAVLLPIWILALLNVRVPALLAIVIRPLVVVADTYPAFLIALVIEHLTWYVGVHSWAAIGPAYFPFLISNAVANATAIAKGAAAPHIATFNSYLGGAGGGTGSHVPLAVFGLRSKSKTLRAVAKAGIVPTLLQINEPILFGFPVVLNPVYFIPMCVLAPLIRSLVFLVISLGWVARPSVMFFAFVPSPLLWYLSTFDWRILIWGTIICYVLPALAYYPFFKMHERILVEEEAQAETAES